MHTCKYKIIHVLLCTASYGVILMHTYHRPHKLSFFHGSYGSFYSFRFFLSLMGSPHTTLQMLLMTTTWRSLMFFVVM